jgi:hypothetical protein
MKWDLDGYLTLRRIRGYPRLRLACELFMFSAQQRTSIITGTLTHLEGLFMMSSHLQRHEDVRGLVD